MNLEECYNAFGGDLEDAIAHLKNEDIIYRFTKRFLEDKSFGKLCDCVANEDYEEAFKAAHSLKGVCLNMCFKNLSKSACKITEFLRDKTNEEVDGKKCRELLTSVTKDYETLINAIRKLD